MIIRNIDPQKIVARAAVMFGEHYKALWLKRISKQLTVDQYVCMIDMECLAELDLLRATGEVPEYEPQSGLLDA